MKTVTYEEFLDFRPCWMDKKGGTARVKAYFDRFGGSMTALDILNLDGVSAEDKLQAVLCEEFIPAPILHEFACVCAEYTLTLIDNPDPRNVKAIEVKRAWMQGEATDKELDTARGAACSAAKKAARTAEARTAARDTRAAAAAARDTACSAASAASRDAACAAWASRDAAWHTKVVSDAAYEAQVAYLIMTLKGEK